MRSKVTPNPYQVFLTCLAEAHVRFGFEVQAWCLMGNHYHLLLKAPRGNLSRVMRHEVFHVGHYSTVSQTIGRLNIELKDHELLSRDFNMLSQDLTP